MRLKRVISAALAVSMAVSMMPATAVSAFATDVGNSVAVQTAGNELTYNCGATENDHVTVSLVKIATMKPTHWWFPALVVWQIIQKQQMFLGTVTMGS